LDHAANWRVHPAHQAAALAGLLAEVGQAAALLVYRSERQGGLCVIDGHLRKGLDPHAVWPCLILDVNDQEADLLLATLDPLIAMANRDAAQLAALLGSLEPASAAVAELLAAQGGPPAPASRHPAGYTPPARTGAEEAIALLQSRFCVTPGQVWRCGRHVVVCGDATEAESYARVCRGTEVQAVVTDPPYGVGIPYEGFSDTLENVGRLIGGFMPHLEGYPVVALTTGVPAMWLYPRPAWVMAWVHPASSIPGPWGWAGFNPILVYGADPYLRAGLGKRQDHVVMVGDRGGEVLHPTTKPLKVWTWLVERMTTEPGQVILDPFLGSGTSLIAAEHTGRRCLGIEQDPGYVAVALDRYARATHDVPTLLQG